MEIKICNKDIELHNALNFALDQTLDCGQAFRWQELDRDIWHGVALGKYLKIGKKDNIITFYNTTEEDFNNLWKDYFDLDRNYGEIIDGISENKVLKEASAFADGIRILRQEPWEALCSFIISQNNNIPRIKGIVERLCENFGDRLAEGFYTFPSAERIASLSLDELAILRSGFRAKYILDAAQRVSRGEINLSALKTANTDDARAVLMQIYGVGAKVADCTLLFGLGHINAFPKDVWIKRAMEKLFDGELPACTQGYEGVVQQYIFHYARMTKLDI